MEGKECHCSKLSFDHNKKSTQNCNVPPMQHSKEYKMIQSPVENIKNAVKHVFRWNSRDFPPANTHSSWPKTRVSVLVPLG